MTEPTIAARLQRKFILMSNDPALHEALQAALPEGWEMVATLDLDSLGTFDQILLYRFIFLDLDTLTDDFDPQDAIRKVRMELMLNVAIFCFGGSQDERDQARLNRADRFFEREEASERLLQFCHQYRWGE
ncbi:hypothetical protein [Sulfuriferula thiophila]|uniref:hypothetical protein n=1 Tax=Sulfuriferula thiophila TaxID=1781211 RepID=UPI000F60C065|nr:hypothetical protein [Sulfuriferula thiophila]